MLSYMLPVRTLRSLLFLVGAISPRAMATGPAVLAASPGSCPNVIVQVEGAKRCTEGDAGCLDDAEGLQALHAIKQGCSEGKGGPGAPCLYGIFIGRGGKATAVCGPRLQEARR